MAILVASLVLLSFQRWLFDAVIEAIDNFRGGPPTAMRSPAVSCLRVNNGDSRGVVGASLLPTLAVRRRDRSHRQFPGRPSDCNASFPFGRQPAASQAVPEN